MSTFLGRLFKKIFRDTDITKYSDDWVEVGKNEYVTLYYNSSLVTIDKQNKTIKVWQKRVFTEKGKIEYFKENEAIYKQIYNDTDHLLSLYLLNYKEWKFSMNHSIFYSKSGKVLLEFEYPLEWVNIIPDSVSAFFFNKIIADYNIQSDDWIYVCSDENCTHYYNSSSVIIDKQNNIIKVLVKDVFTEKGKIEFLEEWSDLGSDLSNLLKQHYIDVNHTLSMVLYKYKEWKRCMTNLAYYSKSGIVLDAFEYPANWYDIPPDSKLEFLINQLLKYYNIQR